MYNINLYLFLGLITFILLHNTLLNRVDKAFKENNYPFDIFWVKLALVPTVIILLWPLVWIGTIKRLFIRK